MDTAYRFHLGRSPDMVIQIAVAYSENMLRNYEKEEIHFSFPHSPSYHIYSFYGETHRIERSSVCAHMLILTKTILSQQRIESIEPSV